MNRWCYSEAVGQFMGRRNQETKESLPKALLEGVLGGVIATALIPLVWVSGLVTLPFLNAHEAWRKGDLGGALVYIVFGAWPVWAILAIVIFST